MTECECYATISESDPRSEIWRQVCPDGRVPLKGPTIDYGYHQGNPMSCYQGDPSRLSADQRALLARLMAGKFGLTPDHVLRSIESGTLPIKDENLTVVVCALHSRLLMSDDSLDDEEEDACEYHDEFDNGEDLDDEYGDEGDYDNLDRD